MRFIDACGDTTLNQLQLPVLLEEIGALVSDAPDEEARTVLTELLALLEQARGRVHMSLKFIGDWDRDAAG